MKNGNIYLKIQVLNDEWTNGHIYTIEHYSAIKKE